MSTQGEWSHTLPDGRVVRTGDLIRLRRGHRAAFQFIEPSANGLVLLKSLKTGGLYLRHQSVIFEIIPRSK